MRQEEREGGNRFGIHRVLDDKLCLPQAAKKLSNQLPIFSNELLIQVDSLNIDAASFVQMEEETNHDPKKIGEIILKNCELYGKQQNRMTGSGGMLIGSILQIGSRYPNDTVRQPKVGDRIATLVSLTLTPLFLEKILFVNCLTHQVKVQGVAILFETSIWQKLPEDLPEEMSMAICDVAGAPAGVAALCKKGDTVVVLGAGGKAGLLSCVAAREVLKKDGKIIAIESNLKAAQEVKKLEVCDHVLLLDGRDPVGIQENIEKLTYGKMGDLIVNVASASDTENSAILCAGKEAKILFYSMATSFSKVTLGAEGIGCTAQLIFGNGYVPGHAEYALNLVRQNASLQKILFDRYGAQYGDATRKRLV